MAMLMETFFVWGLSFVLFAELFESQMGFCCFFNAVFSLCIRLKARVSELMVVMIALFPPEAALVFSSAKCRNFLIGFCCHRGLHCHKSQ